MKENINEFLGIPYPKVKKMRNSNIEEEFQHLGYLCRVISWTGPYLYQGHRCGYVGLPKNHIATIIGNYEDIPVEAHGGLTYGQLEDDGLFWVGFDCAHSGDSKEIWTFEKTKEEVKRIAEQLTKITWRDAIKQKLEYMPEWFTKRIIFRGKK